MVTKEEFLEWKSHPVTIEVYAEIKRAKERLVTHLSEGATIGYEAQVTHGQTNKIIGQIEGLNQLLNLTYEDEELKEEE